MNQIFFEAAIAQALARAIQHIGSPAFWSAQLALLKAMGSFQNALAISFEAGKSPQVLCAHSCLGGDVDEVMQQYLNGLYLLDPFYQACCNGLPSGVYRLEEVAPDRFLQSEYFASYFNEMVGKDEIQLVLQLPERRYLSISLGFQGRPDAQLVGMLAFHSQTLLALIQQHWRQTAGAPPEALTMAEPTSSEQKIEQALEQFGSALLSGRELEVARLILRGNSSKAAASKLGISLETVKVHRRHLYSKLGIRSQPELFNIFLQALS